jgi:hypothetical protein
MSHPDLFVVSILRALVEVALLSLLGQGAVGTARWRQTCQQSDLSAVRGRHPTGLGVCRWLTPKVVLDRHLPFVAFFLSFWLWIVLAYVKRVLCELHGLSAC